jgi:DNA-binding NarL/FixJ family response regulator
MIFAFLKMKQITILFVDDHPLIRKAWDFLLRQDARFKLIGVCDSGEMAIEVSKKLYPDIVIMDIKMRGMSGIEATEFIRKNCPGVKIIGLSFHIEPDYPQKMMESGAMGYLSKISPPEEIFKAITEVFKGKSYICEEMANKLV